MLLLTLLIMLLLMLLIMLLLMLLIVLVREFESRRGEISILFERSEFLIATCKKKKLTVRMSVCMYA